MPDNDKLRVAKQKADKALAVLAHIILPNRCMFCGRPIEYDGRLCPECDDCKPLIPTAENSVMPDVLDALAAPFWYELGADRAVWNLKFSGDFTCARKLAFYMACAWRAKERTMCATHTILSDGAENFPDLAVPVPLFERDFRRRGFNQSEQLAKWVARELEITFCVDGLEKVRSTKTQHELDRAERRENLKDAYLAMPERVGGHSILLIDDVYTTGATLAECAAELRKAGATAVIGLTATRTRAKADFGLE